MTPALPAVIALFALGLSESSVTTTPAIHTEDVDLFFKVYDAASGHPAADQIQHDYIDHASEGLHTLMKVRNLTAARIAETIEKRPELYTNARECMKVLPRAKQRLEVALRKLLTDYPQARTPPVSVVVGRGKPTAIGSPVTGVQVSLESLCAATFMNPNVEDRFVYVLAHEYAHVQQVPEVVDNEHPTVLEGSLMEGAADLTAEVIAGKTANAYLPALAGGREKELETRFLADLDKKDLSDWLDNGTLEDPRNLGYWVGYRIMKTYYLRAKDKRQALQEILEMRDAKAFLAKSGWYPGIKLQ